MTHSHNPYTSTMTSIVDKLFDYESDDYNQLSYIFSQLGLVQDTPAIHRILTALVALLKHGKSINFPPDSNELGSKTVSETWSKWLSILSKTVTRYEKVTPTETYQKNEFTPTSSEIINTLLLPDSKEQANRDSSHIESIKLVLMALVMRPKEDSSGINIDKVVKSFKLRILAIPFIETLNLDFEAGVTSNSIINQCEFLSKTKFQERNTLHIFLNLLRDSLIVLQGYHLGSTKKHHDKKQPATLRIRPKESREPGAIRFTPFHLPANPDNAPDIGNIIEITPEEGEEPIRGVIEPPNVDSDNHETSNKSSSATQIKSKYWIQHFHDALPWNSQGISPFTLKILVTWIKDNDSTSSLIFGLIISAGRRYEDVINMVIGDNLGANITKDGLLIRYIEPPENSRDPSAKQKTLLKPTTQTIHLHLPEIIKSRFHQRCKNCTDGQILTDALGINASLQKKEIQHVIKQLIRKGANGLAIDRIAITLNKKVSMTTGDDYLGYVIAAQENSIPPVTAYYAAYSLKDIQSIYREIVENIFHE